MTPDPALIAWALFPMVAGLQRFSVSYGYQGRARTACRREALQLVALLYAVETIIAFCTWYAHAPL